MTFTGLLNQSLTIQRRSGGAEDEHGNPIPSTTASVAVDGYAEQTQATEVTVDRETYVTNWLVVLPPATAIDGSDHIVHGGVTLEVIGSPHRVWNPRSQYEHHVSVRAREVT